MLDLDKIEDRSIEFTFNGKRYSAKEPSLNDMILLSDLTDNPNLRSVKLFFESIMNKKDAEEVSKASFRKQMKLVEYISSEIVDEKKENGQT